MSHTPLRELCRAVAAEFLRNQGWTLALEWRGSRQHVSDVFLDGVLGYIAPSWKDDASLETKKTVIRRGVLNQYSQVLCRACGQLGSSHAEIAYTELWNHLYDIAHLELRGDDAGAADCAQAALICLFQRFQREPRGFMRDEGAFLAYARKTLLHECWRYVEERGKTLDLYRADSEDDDEMDDVPARGAAVDGPLARHATREDVAAAVRACLDGEQQQRVILGLFLEELTVWEMAKELGCSPENVYVLKSRALTRLRRCRGLWQKLIDALSDGAHRGG